MKFTVFGVKLEFSFWFFAVLAVFVALAGNSPVVYLSLPIITHELGHMAAIAATKTKLERMRFTAFGVEVRKAQGQRLKPVAEVFVSIAGILANLTAAALLHIFAVKSMGVMLVISANLVIAGFNLLPIGNLDGGEITRTIAEYFFKPRLAFILSRLFSFLALVPLFAAAIFLLLQPERNFTLLLVCIYLLTDVMSNCR